MREAIRIEDGATTPRIGEVMDDTRSEITENDSVAGKEPMSKSDFTNSRAGKSQGKYYAFTIHCENKEHCKHQSDIMKGQNDTNVLLFCCYTEQCPKTQRWHIQGYVALKKKRRLSSIFDQLLCVWQGEPYVWPYVKPAIYSAWHNKRYCEKDGDGWTVGEAAEWSEEQLRNLGNKQGKRTDIEAMAKDFQDKPWESKLTKARKFPKQFCHYNRAFDKLLTLERDHQYHSSYDTSKRSIDMKNYVYTGPPGCGKSHTVEQEVKKLCSDFPQLRVYYKTIQKWWDGYDGQEIVVIDDFRSSMPFSELLNLMDGKPFRREAKGTTICLRAHHIFFTTPKHPRYWYKKIMEEDGDAEGQLLRRIYQLREFTPEDNPRYNYLVRRRIRKRNRMGFVIEDADSSGQAPLAPIEMVPNVSLSSAKRPRKNYQGDGFGGQTIDALSCMLCDSGNPCYIHCNNLDDEGYSQEVIDICRNL